MSARFVATVGNGRLLARIGADGSLIGLCAPHLDAELLEKPAHAVLEVGAERRRRIGGRGWKHRREYVRGTNVLRVMSRHSTGIKVERRLAAIGESLLLAFRSEGDATVGWESGLGEVLPQQGIRFDGAWPEGFDPPPLAGATRASVVARVPDLTDRAAIADLYARSVLVIAQHHDRSGSFAADGGEDVLVAHALDACGGRGAARAFFEWALEHDRGDPEFAWGLEQHLRRSHSPELATRLAELQANGGVEPSSPPTTGTGAALWASWQDAVAGRRANAVAALQGAAARRSSLRLFVSGGGVDLAAHALLLLTVHALLPPTAALDDGFFEHQASVQKARHARALYGGAFHSGMLELGGGRLTAEVRSDLDVSAVTLEVDGQPAGELEAAPPRHGHPTQWSGPARPTAAGEVSRYKIRVHLRDADATPMWASDSDPRPGGQEFAFEAAPPPPPEWARDAVCYHVMVDLFAPPGET